MNSFDGTESLTYAPKTVEVKPFDLDPMVESSGVLPEKKSGIKFQIGVDPDWPKFVDISFPCGEEIYAWLKGVPKNTSVALQQARDMEPELDVLLRVLHVCTQPGDCE